jgi:hypothetical protein
MDCLPEKESYRPRMAHHSSSGARQRHLQPSACGGRRVALARKADVPLPSDTVRESVGQATREVLIDEHTVLAPSSDTDVAGDVKLVGLGSRCSSRRGLFVAAGRKAPEILTEVVMRREQRCASGGPTRPGAVTGRAEVRTSKLLFRLLKSVRS